MTKEFNLSEKIWGMEKESDQHINIKFVKEFIRLLKEYGEKWEWEGSEKINELAGEKLI